MDGPNSGAPVDTGGASFSVPFTVSSGANAIVVILVDRQGTNGLGGDPSTIQYGSQTLTQAVTFYSNTSTSGQRDASVYYGYNPTTGSSNNITGTVTQGTDTYITAYSLGGVNTSRAPLTGMNNSTINPSGNNPKYPTNAQLPTSSYTISGIPTGSVATVAAVFGTANSGNNISITDSDSNSNSGILNTQAATGSISTVAEGIFPTVTATGGSETFNSDLFVGGNTSNIWGSVGAVFTPIPEPGSVAMLGIGGLALLIRRRRPA